MVAEESWGEGVIGDQAPEISIIIPHYNDLASLDRCLTSLEAQTIDPGRYEIIVADNMSPSGLAAVEDVVGERARVVSAEERGAGPARNAGLAQARGTKIGFIDCDCVAEPEWLHTGLAALKNYDLVGGRMSVLVADGKRKTGAEAFECVFAFDNEIYVLKKGFSVTANLFCSRNAFENIGAFRTGVSEDLDWCDVTPVFHPAATRDRPLLSRRSAGETTGGFKPARCFSSSAAKAAGVA